MQITLLCLSALTLSVSVALAECDLSDFDTSDPVAVGDTTKGRITKFKWASDEDPSPDGDGKRAWHYVHNLDDDGLALIWEKIDEFVPINHPLQKEEVACFTSFSEAFEVDKNAPITTTTEGEFPAKAFVPKGKSQKTGAGTGRDKGEISGRIQAIIRYFQEDEYLSLELFSSTDDTVFALGVTGLGVSEDELVKSFTQKFGSKPNFEKVIDTFASNDDFSLKFVELIGDNRVVKLKFQGSVEFAFNNVTDVSPVKIPLAMLNPDGQVLAATKIDLAPLVEN